MFDIKKLIACSLLTFVFISPIHASTSASSANPVHSSDAQDDDAEEIDTANLRRTNRVSPSTIVFNPFGFAGAAQPRTEEQAAQAGEASAAEAIAELKKLKEFAKQSQLTPEQMEESAKQDQTLDRFAELGKMRADAELDEDTKSKLTNFQKKKMQHDGMLAGVHKVAFTRALEEHETLARSMQIALRSGAQNGVEICISQAIVGGASMAWEKLYEYATVDKKAQQEYLEKRQLRAHINQAYKDLDQATQSAKLEMDAAKIAYECNPEEGKELLSSLTKDVMVRLHRRRTLDTLRMLLAEEEVGTPLLEISEHLTHMQRSNRINNDLTKLLNEEHGTQEAA